MGEKNVDKANEAVKKLTETVQSSYETLVESTTMVQESNVQLARSVFESGVEALKIQAEIKHHTLQGLAEQVRKHQEVFRELSLKSMGAYEGFLDSLFLYYEEVLEEPEKADD